MPFVSEIRTCSPLPMMGAPKLDQVACKRLVLYWTWYGKPFPVFHDRLKPVELKVAARNATDGTGVTLISSKPK